MGKAYEYGVLLKPKVLGAMLALYVASYLSSHATVLEVPLDIASFLVGFAAVAIAVSGANALNCYLDRDIDALMARTWGRPLALGTIQPFDALAFSGVLLTMAAILSMYLGMLPFLLFLEGSGTYLLLYTFVMKRKTSLNVLATAPSVAAPAWFGWYLGGAPMFPVGWLMGLLVAIWGPLHLWSIAFAYSKDYVRVEVPMFTAVVSSEDAVRGISVALSCLMLSSYLLVPWTSSATYVLLVTLLNIPLTAAGIQFYRKRSKRSGWLLFKLSAPYIVVVLLSYMVDGIFF